MKWIEAFIYYYKYKLAANTISLLILTIPSLNLASRLVLPIALAAQLICLMSSSSRLMCLIMLPSNIEVIEHILANEAPATHSFITSIKNGFRPSTYSSISTSSLHSLETVATLLAVSFDLENFFWMIQYKSYSNKQKSFALYFSLAITICYLHHFKWSS